MNEILDNLLRDILDYLEPKVEAELVEGKMVGNVEMRLYQRIKEMVR